MVTGNDVLIQVGGFILGALAMEGITLRYGCPWCRDWLAHKRRAYREKSHAD